MQKNALQDADIIIRQYDPAVNLLDSWKMPDKFDFIAGGERTWANIYAYAQPLEESGLIIDFSQKSQKILPAVRSGNDLRAAGRFCY